jgi:signal transduction histidine kinase
MKIRSKVSLLILGTSIFLLPFISSLYYAKMRAKFLDQVHAHLESISQTKENQIKDLVRKKYELVTLFSTHKDLIQRLELDGSVRQNAKDSVLTALFRRYIDAIGTIDEINIVSLEGEVFLSSDTSNLGENFFKHDNFQKALSGIKRWEDFHLNKEGELTIFLSGPIYSKDKIIGVVIIETDALDILSLTSDYTGLGSTGETVIGIRKDKTVLVNPLRFDQKNLLQVELDPQNIKIPMNQALANYHGIINKGVDYRNTHVIASVRYIDEVGWGMVTKIDVKEAYAPIMDLMYFLVFLSLGGILITSIIAYFGAHFLAHPIEELKKVVDKMREGDLSTRAQVTTDDEIGDLAMSYNAMSNNLEKKINDLDNFIYTASHDLKAPISNIEALITALPDEISNETRNKKGFHEIMDLIKSSIDRFKYTIQDLTDIARVQKTISEDITDVDIKAVVEDVKALLKRHIDETNATINLDISECPSIKYSLRDLRSVLYNLISNAIKYRQSGKEPVINIITKSFDHEIHLIVQDNGLGIPHDKIGQIFSMFKRFHDHVEGTGVGLYIVKRIIDNNGGRIFVESEVGFGTEFRIIFKK